MKEADADNFKAPKLGDFKERTKNSGNSPRNQAEGPVGVFRREFGSPVAFYRRLRFEGTSLRFESGAKDDMQKHHMISSHRLVQLRFRVSYITLNHGSFVNTCKRYGNTIWKTPELVLYETKHKE
jgi:hypothetical protein